MRNGKPALLLCALSLMLTACGPSASELRLEGIALLEKGSYEEAIVKFDEAMDASHGKISNEQFDILLYRAEAEYMLADYEAALHTYEILEQVDGEKERYTTMKQMVEAKLLVKEASDALNAGELDTARSLLDQAKALGLVTDKDVEFNEIVYLEKTGEWQAAYDAMKLFCERYPNDEAAKREFTFLQTRVGE